jgi:hypothetical protein
MTSFKQIASNRLNALRSTGPKTQEGKQQSRRNALRHGLTAETVEDTEDYRGFEAAVISDYDAQTAVERELVLRLASLLWRLRRIISIETDLFQIQAELLRERQHTLGPAMNEAQGQTSEGITIDGPETDRVSIPARQLTYCFLRLGNLDNVAFERLGRYNASLWRQTAQTLILLQTVRRQY